MTAATATHEEIDNVTAVPTRKRVGDGFTFYSSHKECYELGIHANTPAGREQCRTEPRGVVIDDQRPNTN